MRPIEFRGMRADTGEFVYGYLVVTPDGVYRIYLKPFDGASIYTWYEVIPETVGQFTGTTDKNGVKRFEGDKVRVQGGRKPRGQARPFYETEIVFKNNMFTLKDNFTIYHDYAAINISEVIGTIHDKSDRP